MGFVSASVGAEDNSANGGAHKDQTAKEVKFHFECEGTIASLKNPLLEKVAEGLNSDGWFVPGEKPGYLWSSSGRNIRFYVSEILFTRKLCWHTSDAQIAGEINAADSESSWGASASVQGGWGPFSVAASAEHGEGHTQKSQGQGMKSKAEDKTQAHPNLAIKFYLLKPFTPGPKRSEDRLDDDVESPEDVEEWLKSANPQSDQAASANSQTAAAQSAAAAPDTGTD